MKLIKILMVDDDEAMLLEVQDALDKEGLTNYELFENTNDFRRSIDKYSYIAIIDHFLDGPEEGYEIMLEVFEKAPEARVIVISGLQDNAVMLKYLQGGAAKFLNKNDKNFKKLLVEQVHFELSKVESILSKYKVTL